jgi:general secretion pathway protein D
MAIPTDVTSAAGGDDAFITRLIPVKNTRSSEIAKTLRTLLTKNGDMISYDPTNTLIVTDSVSNLRRLVSIIERLDEVRP